MVENMMPNQQTKVEEYLTSRNWRNLYKICTTQNRGLVLKSFIYESNLGSTELYLEFILENIQKCIKVWDLLISKYENFKELEIQNIIIAFNNFNSLIKVLPGQTNLVDKDDNQHHDWFSNLEDRDRWYAIANLQILVKKYGCDESGNYSNSAYLTNLLIKLKTKPTLNETDNLLGAYLNQIPSELKIWKKKAYDVRYALSILDECESIKNYAHDIKAFDFIIEKKVEIGCFQESYKIMAGFEFIKNRLENIKLIKSAIEVSPTDFDLLNQLLNSLPLGYQFPDLEKVNRFIKQNEQNMLLLKLKKLVSSRNPNEWDILNLVNDIKNSGTDLPSIYKNRIGLAKVRTDVFDILRNNISPRKTLTEREEIYLKIIGPNVSQLQDWAFNEFSDHWKAFQFAIKKDLVIKEIEVILATNDLKKAFELFIHAEKTLETTVFWQKHRNKLLALKEEAEPFEVLLVKLQNCSNSDPFERNMAAFKDLINFPLKYKGYKPDLEALILEKLKTWNIVIDKFEKLPDSNVLWYLGWNWLHLNLINRIYISLQKNCYPLKPEQSPLVKETHPYEFKRHQSGTLIISNSENFHDFILTIWPGAEFFSYQEKKEWIKIVGQPRYFKWNAKRKKWNQCNRP